VDLYLTIPFSLLGLFLANIILPNFRKSGLNIHEGFYSDPYDGLNVYRLTLIICICLVWMTRM
jgi:hypothetical protein